MRKYNTDRIMESIVCNKCGKEIKVVKGIAHEGVFHSAYQWDYFSEKDGEIHSFDLCEACYNEIVSGFVLKPEIAESTELI